VDAGRHLLRHGDPVVGELTHLLRVVGQQPDGGPADGEQHLGGGGVVALVGPVAQGDVRRIRVEAVALQLVGVELGVEADAATLLAQVEQVPAGSVQPDDRLVQLWAAVAPFRAEDVTGEALAVEADQGRPGRVVAQREPRGRPEPEGQVLAPVDETGEGERSCGGGVAAGQPQRDGDLGADRGAGQGGRHVRSPRS
jgi:hypothetical protein